MRYHPTRSRRTRILQHQHPYGRLPMRAVWAMVVFIFVAWLFITLYA